MGYEYIAVKDLRLSDYKNNPDASGLKFYVIDPQFFRNAYAPFAGYPGLEQWDPQPLRTGRYAYTDRAYSQADEDWYNRHMVWKSNSQFPNNFATGFMGAGNQVPVMWDVQQQFVIDELVNRFIEIFRSYEVPERNFTFAGWMVDVPKLTGEFCWWDSSVAQPRARQTAGISYWRGEDSGINHVGVDGLMTNYGSSQIVHGNSKYYATYSEGLAAFYKQVKIRMLDEFPDPKWIIEPFNLYGALPNFTTGSSNNPDEWVNRISAMADSSELTPNFLSQELSGTDFVDNSNNFNSGMAIARDRAGITQPNAIGEYENRLYAAKAGIYGSWYNWFGRYGGSGNMLDFQSITEVYPRLKLIRCIPNWDNLNKIPLSERSWNGSAYQSTHEGKLQSYIDASLMYSRHWKTGKLFAVFNNANGRIQLNSGETVSSAYRVDGYFIETGADVKSSDFNISGNQITMTRALTATEQAQGVGYIFTVVQSTASAPTVTTGSGSNITPTSATISATVNPHGLSTTVYFQHGTTPGNYTGRTSNQSLAATSTTAVSVQLSSLSPNTRYYYRVVATNSAGTSYGEEMSFITLNSVDTAIPAGSISINNGASYANTTDVALSLSATDDRGVTGYYLSTSSVTPLSSASGWVTINSTTNYSASVNYTLTSGDGLKTVYCWYKDRAGNISTAASDSITLDTIFPTINIISPTSNTTYIASGNTINLSGDAARLVSVSWENNRGGSGIANGTTSWSVSRINLYSGDNVITVTATDRASNTASDILMVTYNSSILSPTVTTTQAVSINQTAATLNGLVNAHGLTSSAYFHYGTSTSSYTGTTASRIINGTTNTTVSTSLSGLSANTTYYYRLAANNSAGISYGNQMNFTTTAAADTIRPTGTIRINNNTLSTNTTPVTLSLSATDNSGVVGYYLSTSNITPTASSAGWTAVASTASYTANNIVYALSGSDGTKTVYCWYKDAAGNVSSVASDSIILDSTAPLISISSPTTLATHATLEGIVSLSGTASDSASGVLAVEWSSNRGGSGIATGTTNWGIDAVSLLEGENVVTVTARDTAGNSASDTITITYSIPNASTVTTGGSSNVTGSSATISGTVNPDGAETNVWFEVGTSSEWYALSVPAQVIGATAATTTVTVGLTELSEGTTYYYRIVAQNNAGISYGTQKSFTTRDAVAPQGSISINFNAQTTNSRNVILILYATDNVGVRGYYVSLNSTKPLATALGWMNIDQAPEYYAEISYSLSAGEGAKTVYCWYKDGAGNVSSGASNTIIFDTTGPAISITLPTSNTTYSTRSEVVSLQGTARDALSQISSIGWVTSQGGEGFIEVNEDWQIPWVYLPVGENIITVTATDTVGNTNKDTITITYIPPIASTVTTGAYSNVTGSSATISGAVDPGGAETNVWFEVGTISGWYALSVPTQVIGATAATTTVSVELTELARGTTYYYRVVAQNSVGISYGSERSFTAQ